MSTATLMPDLVIDELPEVVELRSPYAGLRMYLTHDRHFINPTTGAKEVTEPGVGLAFRNGRCSIRREHMELLMARPEFSGRDGSRPIVYLADDPRAHTFGAGGGVGVVSGAASSTRDQVATSPPPLPGWDDLTPVQIREALEKGRVEAPIEAMAYEFRPGSGRRRESVKRLLFQHSEGDELEEVPVEAIGPDDAAPMPTEARKV